MINMVMLTGRLVRDPELIETESGRKVCNMTLAIPRSYKNSEGIYETDFIDFTAWGSMAINMVEYCKKGDLIGVRGRLETTEYEKDGQKIKSMKVMAEKLSFISSRTPNVRREEVER